MGLFEWTDLEILARVQSEVPSLTMSLVQYLLNEIIGYGKLVPGRQRE